MRNQILKDFGIKNSIIRSINYIIHLSVLDVIILIIKKFGINYLLKYILILSIL